MNDDLKERATAALKESQEFDTEQKADKDKEYAKLLKKLMSSILETDVNPNGESKVIVDGLTFRAFVRHSNDRETLVLVTRCSKNHKEIVTEIKSLKDLGHCIENPKECPCCKAETKPDIETRLKELDIDALIKDYLLRK